MSEEKWLGLHLDSGDDTAAVFVPAKVVGLLQRAFPDTEVDPTDHQQVQLERELGFWSRDEVAPEHRRSLVLQSWGNYKRNGPTYRFVVPFPPGHKVRGQARRMSVVFWLPADLTAEHQEQLRAFLASLRLGVLEFGDCGEDEPFAAAVTAATGR